MLAKEELKQTILSGIYNTIIVNDIGYKNGLREPELVALVAKYLADSIGQLINPNKIVNTLKSANFDISYNAVQRYLKYFEEAYLFINLVVMILEGERFFLLKVSITL